MVGVGAANILTGPLSILTPVILAGLNFYIPFTD